MEACSVEAIHENVVQKVKAKMPSDDDLLKLSDLYKAMGDFNPNSYSFGARSVRDVCL